MEYSQRFLSLGLLSALCIAAVPAYALPFGFGFSAHMEGEAHEGFGRREPPAFIKEVCGELEQGIEEFRTCVQEQHDALRIQFEEACGTPADAEDKETFRTCIEMYAEEHDIDLPPHPRMGHKMHRGMRRGFGMHRGHGFLGAISSDLMEELKACKD
jgi:hypothetical protein